MEIKDFKSELQTMFGDKVAVSEDDHCWLWNGCIREDGYAQAFLNKKTVVVHRVVWSELIGEIPKGKFVLHSCENKSCVNPSHMYLGNTQVKGKKHYKWAGGRYVDFFGYVMAQCKGHPDANRYGYLKEHRLVVEKHIGRRLLKSETVHHINGCKTDNRIENLELLSNKAHVQKHSSGKNNPRYVDTDKIIAELKRVSNRNGGEPLSYAKFCKQSKMASGACRLRFGSWNNAKKEAGIL